MKRHIKIITDGSCDLPKEVIERVNPGIIGINVCFGEESYIGGVEIDDKTFYEKMKVSNAPKNIMSFLYFSISFNISSIVFPCSISSLHFSIINATPIEPLCVSITSILFSGCSSKYIVLANTALLCVPESLDVKVNTNISSSSHL